MLRVSEFTTKNKSDSSTEALQLSDVVVSDCQLKINIKKSKTDQRGYSTFIVINKYRDNANICPVLTLKKYWAARPAVSGCYHLFMHFDGSPLTRYQLSAMLRKSVNFCNIPNPNLLKSHSFRIGAATEASKRGINDEAIKKWGRWSSVHLSVTSGFLGENNSKIFNFFICTYRTEVNNIITNSLNSFWFVGQELQSTLYNGIFYSGLIGLA